MIETTVKTSYGRVLLVAGDPGSVCVRSPDDAPLTIRMAGHEVPWRLVGFLDLNQTLHGAS
jgi:hypothetical protein